MRANDKQCYANKIGNTDGMDKFLDRGKLPKLTKRNRKSG